MTDLNTAYRTDQDSLEEDDPLAELARIVSGEPVEESQSAATHVRAVETQDLDIEAQLMRELGEAEPAPVSEAVAQETFETVPPTPEPVEVAALDEGELSLEDQLMAELGSVEEAPAVATEVVYEEPAPAGIEEEIAPIDEPLQRVEEVAANIQNGINPSFDDPQFDYSEAPAEHIAATATDAVIQENDAPVDELDEFFTDNFADMLESEQAAELDQAPEQSANRSELDDFDFGEAFNAELTADEALAPSADADLEDVFTKAFESELSLQTSEPAIAAAAVSFEPTASPAPAPVMPVADPMLDPQSQTNALDDFDANDFAKPAPASSGSGFKMAVGALCLALLVGVGVVSWGSLGGGSATDEPVVIKADTEPAKVKPEEPGGKQIANQDNQVYNKVAGTQSEEPAQETLISSRETVAVEPKTNDRLAPKAEPKTETAALGISPKKVKTFTVKPDGTIVQSAPAVITDAATTEPVETAFAQITETTAPAAETTTPAAEEDTSVLSLDGATSTGAIAVPAPSPLPAAVALQTAAVEAPAAAPAPKAVVAAPKPVVQEAPATQPAAADPNAPTQIANLNQAPKPAVTSSEWKVQVSSQRSREAAESSFNNIQRRFGSVLSGKTASIQQANVEGKGTFYRVKVLASSKTDAANMCSRLKAAGGSCFVTR